jgi:phosphoglycolate phosphatase/putative hydrolase of the HAD superfamily
MKIFHLPAKIRGIIFDMDSTLYTNEAYQQFQIDVIIERLAKIKNLSFDEMNAQIKSYRDDWAKNHDGKKTSLGNACAAFGISIEESARWREELYHPEDFLSEDVRLQETIKLLMPKFSLSIVTNNSVGVAKKTLAVLGIESFFHHVIGLDTTGFSKPHEEPFLRAAREMKLNPENCISVGDRYDIDLAIPLNLGMGGILVTGAEDVYELPKLLEYVTHGN